MTYQQLLAKKSRGETLTADEQTLLEDLSTQQPQASAPTGHLWRPSCEEPIPPPDVANARYGPHERHALDLWLAKSPSNPPAPLVLCFHGGGFRAGDKSMNFALRNRCLAAGFSVAAVNYRLSQHAIFPASMLDAARAVQFLRANAAQWNLDPARIASTGNSAGAGISLWLAFHKDLADGSSADPVARESTRVSCAIVFAAQCSYDPRFIHRITRGDTWKHPAVMDLFGVTPEQALEPPAEKAALFDLGSPISLLKPGAPPVYMIYNTPRTAPSDNDIHHPNFGVALKEKMDALKIECLLRCKDDDPAQFPTEVEFLKKHLG